MPAPVRHISAAPGRRTAARAPRKDREGPIHRACLDYLRCVLPHAAAATLHHSPNEEMNEQQRMKAASLGTRPGWPDIEWLGRMDDDRPYWAPLEVKDKGRAPSQAQLDCHDALMDAGAFVGVARSIDDVRAFLIKHDIPCRDMLVADGGGSPA